MPAVEILYFAGCPSYRKARENAQRAIASAGVEAQLKMTLVRHARDAKRLDFHGSPTVRVDGQDIDPEGLSKAPEVGLLSRGYNFKGHTFAEPPEAMIREALLRAAKKAGTPPR